MKQLFAALLVLGLASVLFPFSALAFEVTGQVTAQVHDDPVVCGPPELRPLASTHIEFFEVEVDGTVGASLGLATTLPDGTYSHTISGASRPVHYRTALAGPWAAVLIGDPRDSPPPPSPGSCIGTHVSQGCATTNSPLPGAGSVSFVWDDSNSLPGERASFYWVNRAHDWVKSIDDTFTGIDEVVQLYLVEPTVAQNFEPPLGLRLGGFLLDPSKLSSEMLGVVVHEYGHIVGARVGDGIFGTEIEGIGDALAAFVTKQPYVVRSAYPGRCNDWIQRDAENRLDVRFSDFGQNNGDYALYGIAHFVWTAVGETAETMPLDSAIDTIGELWLFAMKSLEAAGTTVDLDAHVAQMFVEDANRGGLHVEALCLAARRHGHVDVADDPAYACAPLPDPFPASGVSLAWWEGQEEDWLGLQGEPKAVGAFVTDDGEYALYGLRDGVVVVDITTPAAPVKVAEVPLGGGGDRSLASYGDFAYSVSANGAAGLAVIDLRGVEDDPPEVLVSVPSGFATADGNALAVDSARGHLYLAGAGGFDVLSLVDPQSPDVPVAIGSWTDAGLVALEVAHLPDGSIVGAAFTGGADLHIVDLADAQSPTTLSVSQPFGSGASLAHGWLDPVASRLFIGDSADHEAPLGFQFEAFPSATYVVDPLDPSNPVTQWQFSTQDFMRDAAFQGRGRHLFEANHQGGLRIFDVSSSQSVQEAGFFATFPSHPAARGISLLRDLNVLAFGAVDVSTRFPNGSVVVADRKRGLLVLDPQEAVLHVASIDPPDGTDGMAFTIHGDGFDDDQTVKIGNLAVTDAEFVSSTEITGTIPTGAVGILDVTVEDPDFEDAVLDDGFTAFERDKVELAGRVRIADVEGVTRGSDIFAYVSPPTQLEYVFYTHDVGVSVVRLPALGTEGKPEVIHTVPRPQGSGGESAHRDVRVLRSHERAYVTGWDYAGLQILNLQNIDAGVDWDPQTVDFPFPTWTAPVHNITINEDSGWAYVSFGVSGEGFGALDLANPDVPEEKGQWGEIGASPIATTHEVTALTYPPGTPYAGQEILFVFNVVRSGVPTAGIDILRADESPSGEKTFELLATATYSGLIQVHHGVLSDDLRYLLVEDEGDEISQGAGTAPTRTYVLDVRDLHNPREVGILQTGLDAVDHHLEVVGDFVYEANYQDGLWIFDISDLPDGHVVGFFDTFPEPANPFDFSEGLWAPYVELPSGRIAANDIDRGLFIFDPTEAVFSLRDLDVDRSEGTFTLEGAGFREGMTLSFGGVPVVLDTITNSRFVTGTLPPGVVGPVEITAAYPNEPSWPPRVAPNAFGPEAPCDLDFSGQVDVADALLASRAMNGDVELGFAQLDNAEVSSDPKDRQVTAADVLLIQRAANGEPISACSAP